MDIYGVIAIYTNKYIMHISVAAFLFFLNLIQIVCVTDGRTFQYYIISLSFIIIIISNLSNDRSKASYKASSPH